MTNSQALRFHYYNKDGLFAKSQELRGKLFDLVENGHAKAGCLLAHDFEYNYNSLQELLKYKRLPSSKFNTWVIMMQSAIESCEKYIASKTQYDLDDTVILLDSNQSGVVVTINKCHQSGVKSYDIEIGNDRKLFVPASNLKATNYL